MGVVRSTDRQAGESNFSGIAGKVLLDPDAGAGAVTLGELLIDPGAELPLHKHLVEEAFFIFEGEGLALIGEDEIPVSAGGRRSGAHNRLSRIPKHCRHAAKDGFLLPRGKPCHGVQIANAASGARARF